MSFGAAADRGRTLAASAPCPCGGGEYGSCCGPVLAGGPAASPEALMRSRFTAFALGDVGHLRASWHPATVPDALDLDDAVRWERLEILRADGGRNADRRGTVEFRAHWRDVRTGERGVLSEISRFRRAGESWLYLDGAIEPTGRA
ncbi:YchJ family protein [Microbacterium dextranolyticum]|nr:YchJ family metal-binding protein [Microbacterium dextranolyticum]MBM7462681.1 SEC-C motif-containing protein [Microbacterium dextranolyticum]